jgi:hypothetical protein
MLARDSTAAAELRARRLTPHVFFCAAHMTARTLS